MILTSPSVFKIPLAVITAAQGVLTNIIAFYSCGWMSLSRVKPHQWSRSISAHWLSKHPSLCRKDSVRLMRGQTGRQTGRQADQGSVWHFFVFYLVRLFTSCNSSTGFHCWLMVRSCREAQEIKVRLLLTCFKVAHQLKLTGWAA